MSLVEASGPDTAHLFPSHGDIDRTLVSAEISSCSIRPGRNAKDERDLCADPASPKAFARDRTFLNRALPEIGPYRLTD
ncbi:MAG: hypothetical protein JST04_13635 [Bdellovibrionales bacterium]|nr:hypothetical protein [Bdellovibrionales bacterium]